MSDELDRAARYLNKASELRTIANDEEHSAIRDALLKIAHTYEQMAGSMERLHDAETRTLKARDPSPSPTGE